LGDWLESVLGHVAEADRGHPGTWQIAVPPRELQDPLTPYLETAGFMYRSTTLRMGWEGERVTMVDATPVRLSGYAGGDPETDAAIVELHNRSYGRLTPRADVESLWMRWDGLEAQEYVLAREGDRLVGYAQWRVTSGEAWVISLVVARSHWGTNVAPACGTRTMEHLLGLGYHKVFTNAVSTNAPTIDLHRRMGFRVVAEESRTFVRTL
jgi:RimJ/RimL family protein N-acetyltransferase